MSNKPKKRRVSYAERALERARQKKTTISKQELPISYGQPIQDQREHTPYQPQRQNGSASPQPRYKRIAAPLAVGIGALVLAGVALNQAQPASPQSRYLYSTTKIELHLQQLADTEETAHLASDSKIIKKTGFSIICNRISHPSSFLDDIKNAKNPQERVEALHRARTSYVVPDATIINNKMPEVTNYYTTQQ